MLVEDLSRQSEHLLALFVEHVHGLAVGALDDEAVDAALGQACEMRADRIKVDCLVRVEEGDGGDVDAARGAGN